MLAVDDVVKKAELRAPEASVERATNALGLLGDARL